MVPRLMSPQAASARTVGWLRSQNSDSGRFRQSAAGLGQVDLATGFQAPVEQVRLLTVVDALAHGHRAVRCDLARVVQRAPLAAPVAGVVDPDDLACAR